MSLFQPSEVTLNVPLAVASDIDLADLTAPSARLAIALISIADKSGRIDVLKRDLERVVGVRLDNASRLLEPVMHRFLADVTYVRGEQGKTAGIITGRLSGELTYGLVGQSAGRTVQITADELRDYRSSAAITFRLRVGAAFADPATRVARWRITAEKAAQFFGPTVSSVAALKRDNAAGEKVTSISLARAGKSIIMPAISDLNERAEGIRVTAKALLDGDDTLQRRRWIAIDVEARRYERVGLADLAKRARHKASIG